MPLSVRQHQALLVEGRRFEHGGARITAIRELVGWSEVRQAQVVAALIRTPEALEAHPALCRRLLRLEDQRRSARRA